MARKDYIQFPSIIGGSTDRVHLGWFDVLSWNIGTTSGRAKYDSFSFEVELDKGVADLVNANMSSKTFAKVTLDGVREDGSLYGRYEFKTVVISTLFYSSQNVD